MKYSASLSENLKNSIKVVKEKLRITLERNVSSNLFSVN